jgi:hypothetical protein
MPFIQSNHARDHHLDLVIALAPSARRLVRNSDQLVTRKLQSAERTTSKLRLQCLVNGALLNKSSLPDL